MHKSAAPASLATKAVLVLALAGRVFSQSDDIIWHDRYHALLAMSAYGAYDTLCPAQTFSEASMLKNFPNSTLVPWTVLERWGPTASGAEGFSVVVPEMAKVVQVWKGDYNLEKALDPTPTSLDALNLDYDVKPINFGALGIAENCADCAVNAFALQGYLEAKAATNNWAISLARYKELSAQQPFYYSIAGHGLGGMHGLISSIVLGTQNISFFTHSYGSPRTFNPSAAALYDSMYGGDNVERAIANGDSFVTAIPQDANHTFTNTGYLWYGYNATYEMNRVVCYEDPENEACMPMQSDTPELDHYFYFTNVGQCGGDDTQNTSVAQAYIDSVKNSSITASVSLSNSSVGTLTATSSTPFALNSSTSYAASSATVTMDGMASIVANASSTPSASSTASGTDSAAAGLAAADTKNSSSAASAAPTSGALKIWTSLVTLPLVVSSVAILCVV
ncbi:MAG: hypothetical protein CYPHOPRED_000844 [Cyphobasidiales sp. Tagirdzhanova-0007]|nr:MAG: hypothetical protein CYPHOPRED_000844 [Cyphobasidiales sp. Tagirdzhanova-0007]